MKILDYRKRKHAVFLENEQDHRGEEDNEDSDSQECDEYEAYMSDERLRTALDKIPSKNIAYSSDDMRNILELFEVVKMMVSEKNTSRINMKASSLTVDMLDKNSYYSQLTARTLLRWYEMKDN